VAVAAEAAATLPASGTADETAAEAAVATAAAAAALTTAMGDLYSRHGPYGANFLSELAAEYKAALGAQSKVGAHAVVGSLRVLRERSRRDGYV
jgi:hypothetical protein